MTGPGIPGALLATRIYVRESWLKDHPREQPPETEMEVAIVVMAVEQRESMVITPGQPTQTEQRGWPVIELARIPYYAWRRKMDELFGVTQEAANVENPSSGGPGTNGASNVLGS